MKAKLITLPNIITLANLLCGTVAVISMVSLPSAGALRVAFVLMLAAALFDFLDGFVARLTGQYSPVGAQLDSLADMVSFVVLPTIIAMKIYYLAGGYGAWSAVMLLITACGAVGVPPAERSSDTGSTFRTTRSGSSSGCPYLPALCSWGRSAGTCRAVSVSLRRRGCSGPYSPQGRRWHC